MNQNDNFDDARLRERLQKAVRNIEPPAYLDARIRARIREQEPARTWRFQWAAVAAGAAVIFGATVAYNLGHLRYTRGSQESYIAKVTTQIATLMRVGLGDHLHCAFFRKFPENPPTMEEFAAKLGPEYSGLLPVVREQVPADYRLEIAHECGYNGRKFIHFVLRNDSQLMSMVIARKQDGESFAIEGLAPELMHAETPVYASSVQRFQIASFESQRHLVYFISDLSKDQNTQMLVALSPRVKEFLKKLEL